MSLLLAVMATAAPAAGAEFTVRWGDDDSDVRAAGVVSLYPPCASYDCGLALLTGDPAPGPALRSSFEAGGLFRGDAPDGDGWWVVVSGGGRMPMAMFWRPPVAAGHLPAAPVVEAGTCRILVRDEDDRGVPGAVVSAAASTPVERPGFSRTPRASVLGGWRPWLPLLHTDVGGRADVQVPAQGAATLRIGALGHQAAQRECRAGADVVVELQRQTERRRFVVVTEQAVPLGAALVRGAFGWPLGVTSAEGSVELDIETSAAGRLWIEEAAGAVHEASFDREGRIVARPASALRRGVIGLARLPDPGGHVPGLREGHDEPAEPAPPPAEIRYWRDSKRPWPALDGSAATPLHRSTDGRYQAHLLDEEALWFEAAGRGYDYCAAEDLERGTAFLGREPLPCPALPPTRVIDGRVIDERGVGVADAEVLLLWRQARSGLNRNFSVLAAAAQLAPRSVLMLLRSDARGRFSSHRMAAPPRRRSIFGSPRVNVERAGYLPVTFQTISTLRGDDGRFEITLLRGATVRGRVLDRAGGLPVAGAEVALGNFASRGHALALGPLDRRFGPYGNVVRSARTGPDGAFAFTGWPGRRDFLARAEGRAPHQIRGLQLGPEGVDVGEIRLGPGFEIEGVVLDQAGSPVPQTRVLAAGVESQGAFGDEPRDRQWRFNAAATVMADEDGRFVVAGLDEDLRVSLSVTAPGFAHEILEEQLPTNGSPLEIVLEPEAVIAGRVTLRGEPVPARIELQGAGGQPPAFIGAHDDGAFRTSGLRAGRYAVDISARGSDARNWRRSVVAAAGEVTEIDAVLQPKARGHSVRGRVTANGVGLPDVGIRVDGRETATAADGRYAIEGVSRGDHFVVADRGDRWWPASESVRVRRRVERVDFDFSEFEVSGRLFWADGSPVAGEEVSFSGERPWTGGRTSTGSDGAFAVQLERGTYSAGVADHHGRWMRTRRPFRVAAPRSDLRLRFGRRLKIEGRVYGLTDRELRGLVVEAVNEDDFDDHGAQVDSSGRFVIHGVDSGSWLVVGAVGASERRVTERVRVRDEDIEVDLVFERWFELGGVALVGGEPYRSTPVLLIDGLDWASARRVWTRHDGSFRFVDLPPGRYTVGVGAKLREVRVDGDEHLVIDLGSGSITGVARRRDGSAAGGAVVLLWPAVAPRWLAEELGIVWRTYTDGAGGLAFDRVPEGVWTLEIDDLPGSRQSVSVRSGAVATVLAP